MILVTMLEDKVIHYARCHTHNTQVCIPRTSNKCYADELIFFLVSPYLFSVLHTVLCTVQTFHLYAAYANSVRKTRRDGIFERNRNRLYTKLPFFQKAASVVVIVEFARIQDYGERREGAYARDERNIRANAPSPLLSKSSVQKGGGSILEFMVD